MLEMRQVRPFSSSFSLPKDRMPFSKLVIVHGGELAKDVAEQIQSKCAPALNDIEIRSASERPKKLLDLDETVLVCFVLQTIENAAPTEDGGATVRFFKRKTHPEDLLADNKFQFCVLGLGDSNLLLDRQTTTEKDCNQVAQEFDSRLESLKGQRFHELGLADERTELTTVEPWIDGLVEKLK